MRNDLNKKKKMVGLKKRNYNCSNYRKNVGGNDAPCEEVPMNHFAKIQNLSMNDTNMVP